MKKKNQNFVGLRELRENTSELLKEIEKGHSFTVLRRSKPLFRVTPLNEDENWEEVIDFTKMKKGGIDIDDVLSRL